MTIGILFIAWFILVGWAYYTIKNAPFGYEDESGFHEMKGYS